MITGKWVKSRARMLKTRSSITVKPAMGKIGGIYEASWETFREGDKFTALREVREACHQRHSCPGHIPSSSHPAQPGTSCIMKEGAEPKKSFPLYFSGLKYSIETNPFFLNEDILLINCYTHINVIFIIFNSIRKSQLVSLLLNNQIVKINVKSS